MIQRIQSIFLLLASISAFSLFAFPFATAEKMANSQIFADGIYNINDNIGLMALFPIAGLLTLISIFLFKDRKKQLLIDRIALVVGTIGFILMALLFMQDAQNMTEQSTPSEGIGVGLPILFLIFTFLANFFINKDEKLVRSMDRLR